MRAVALPDRRGRRVIPEQCRRASPTTTTRETGARRRSEPLDPPASFEHALAGHPVHVVDDFGARQLLPVTRWLGDADDSDLHLLVEHCAGPTLDLGCGPGRLLAALRQRSVFALGVDTSACAVAHARRRGGRVLHTDLFESLPGLGRWRHALLADGNIGIGGDPVRLLRRVAQLLHPLGNVLVEVGPAGTGLRRERLRFEVDGALSPAFPWARVGFDAIAAVAHRSGLRLQTLHQLDERWVAELCLPAAAAFPCRVSA